MIAGAHAIVFAEDAEAARAFRDVLDFPAVDVGDGWLISGLPPVELACPPGSGWGAQPGRHVLFLMCEDIEQTVSDLEVLSSSRPSPMRDGAS